MANLKDTLVLGKLTVTDSIIAKKLITDGTNNILLADGTTLAQSSLTNSSTMQALSERVTTIEGAYVPDTGNSTIAGNKTFTGCISSSGGMAFTTGLDENANLPFFLGIESYANGGTVRYVTASNAKVGYATTAGSATIADKVVGSYTHNGGQQNPNYFGVNKVGFLMMNTPVNGNTHYKDWLIMDCYSGNDVGGGVAFGVNRQSLGAYIMRSEKERTSWSETAELALLSTGNTTTNYIPKFTNKNIIGNSSIADDGTSITLGRATSVSGLLTITNQDNTVTIGSQNKNWMHIYNSANIPFIFNKDVASTDGNLGTDGYPWKNIKFNGELQFFSGTAQKAKFEYNTSDKCIDVIFN